MRPLSAPLTPGLPPSGSPGPFIGRDAQGGIWLLRWDDFHGWEVLGWEGFGRAATPTRRQLAGEHQGLIKGHVEIAGSGGDAGPEGAAGEENAPRPAPASPEGVRALVEDLRKRAELYRAVAQQLDEIFNGATRSKRIGFALFTFEFGRTEGGRVNYVSNAERTEMLVAVREWLARAEGRAIDPETVQ